MGGIGLGRPSGFVREPVESFRSIDMNGLHRDGKLVPPEKVIQDEFTMRARQRYRTVITERILREARIDDQVSAAMAKLDRPAATELVDQVETAVECAPADLFVLGHVGKDVHGAQEERRRPGTAEVPRDVLNLLTSKQPL